MPYEIPQQLQYEEKIIFGLTFKQLIYAAIFMFPALFIFLKTDWDIYVKSVILVILLGIASLFIFFNLFSNLRNFMSWVKFREAWLLQPKMIQFLGIEKIDKGVVYVWKTKKPKTK